MGAWDTLSLPPNSDEAPRADVTRPGSLLRTRSGARGERTPALYPRGLPVRVRGAVAKLPECADGAPRQRPGVVRLARIVASLLTLTVGLVGPLRITHSQEPAGGTPLKVQQLRVSPTVILSGGTVSVEAVVRNRGATPVHDLWLGLAVAERGASVGRWVPLDRSPAEPIEVIAPGATVRFSGRVRLEGDGWFRVGLAGAAGRTPLLPEGRSVRVVRPAGTAVEVALLFGVYSVLAVAVAGTAWLLLGRRRGDAPALQPA